MNRSILIHRLRGPAVLLLIGMLALFNQTGLIHHFWGWFWPLLMITIGVLMLAERAALSSEDYYPPQPYPGYPGAPYPGADPNMQPAQPQPGTAIVPSGPNDLSGGGNGGQL